MFDKLIDFLLSVFDRIMPVVIVKQYEEAALFRFGKYLRIMGPGIHFKIPIFDDPELHTVVVTTLDLPPQSVTTLDGQAAVVHAMVKYEISSLEVFAVKVYDARAALRDQTCGIIFDVIRRKTWDETHAMDMNTEITRDARKAAKAWGISVKEVTIMSYQKMMSLRLISGESYSGS